MFAQFQVEHDQLLVFKPWIEAIPVRVLVDHCGRPTPQAGLAQPGFAALLDLAGTGRVHVKLSGYAKFSAATLAVPRRRRICRRAPCRLRPDRCMWAWTGRSCAPPSGRTTARCSTSPGGCPRSRGARCDPLADAGAAVRLRRRMLTLRQIEAVRAIMVDGDDCRCGSSCSTCRHRPQPADEAHRDTVGVPLSACTTAAPKACRPTRQVGHSCRRACGAAGPARAQSAAEALSSRGLDLAWLLHHWTDAIEAPRRTQFAGAPSPVPF